MNSVDSEGTDQKVDAKENEIKQGSSHCADAARVAELGGTGAAIGGLATRTWTGAGIGGAVGGATVLLSRGKKWICIRVPPSTWCSTAPCRWNKKSGCQEG